MSIPSRPASGLRRPSQIKSFRAPPARELLLFCLSKREVTKRKRHPAWRLPPIPGRQVREPEPGFSAARPCTVEKASASCRCPLARPVVSVSPPHRGPTKRARSARTLRKARKPPCRSLATSPPHRVRARIGPPAVRGPCAAVRLGREGPQGARQEVEHFSTVHGCAAEKPGPASRTFRAGGPESAKRGASLFGYLSLGQARESNSRAEGARNALDRTAGQLGRPVRFGLSALRRRCGGRAASRVGRPRWRPAGRHGTAVPACPPGSAAPPPGGRAAVPP